MTAPRRVRPFPFAELPRLLRAQVEAGRALFPHLAPSRGPEWGALERLLGGPVRLSLVEAYALPARELEARSRGARIRLVGPGERQAVLVIDARLAPRLARRALGVDESAPELPAPRPLTVAEEGALELCAQLALEAAPLQPEGVQHANEPLHLALGADAWVLAVDARLDTPLGSGTARVLAPASLRLAFPTVSAQALLPRARRLESARVMVRLIAARTPIARADLAALAPGDAIVFEGHPHRDGRDGPLALRLGRVELGARLHNGVLTVETGVSALAQGGARMDTKDERPADAGEPQLLSELPVEVACELGRVTLSGREVLELRPGAVVPVGRPLSGPIDLTVGDRVIARGELVDVEGELGVRILEMLD